MKNRRDFTDSHLLELFGLLVVDLRNPAASIGANLIFLKETQSLDASAAEREALGDAELALTELGQGLEQASVVVRWLSGESGVPASDADVAVVLNGFVASEPHGRIRLEITGDALPAKGASMLPRLMGLLMANSAQHAPASVIRVRAFREGELVVVEHIDQGRALAYELREAAFTLAGQRLLRGRPDGRYGRSAALLAARALADSIDARIEAGGVDGRAEFRVLLRAL